MAVQILFCLSFFPNFYSSYIYYFCNKTKKKKTTNSWKQRKYLEGFNFWSQQGSAGRKGHLGSWLHRGPLAENQACRAESPLAGTNEAWISARHISKPCMPTVVMCLHKALPQAMSHLPKDNGFVNKSFILKIIYFLLTLALLTLKKAQQLLILNLSETPPS